MHSRPRALLLDFGGVIADAPPQPPASAELVQRLHDLLDGAVPRDRVARALVAGSHAYAAWRDQVSADEAPIELSHAQVWQNFVTCHWPAAVHAAVSREATALSYDWARHPQWALRPGIRQLLETATTHGIPMAVVSNTLCGAAHRDFLDQVGLADRFAIQLYSDEAGIRKPNPEMAWRAAHALHVPIGETWFIGDSYARDIACSRRAGVGAAILMRSPRTGREEPLSGCDPDAVVEDGHGVLDLLLGNHRG